MPTWIQRVLAYLAVVLLTLILVPRLMLDQFLYFPEKRLDASPSDFGLPYEEVWLTTEDGVKLHAWWVGKKEHETTVLFLHGNAGNISHRLDRVRALQEIPARFLLLEYRGYGKSEGKPTEEGLYKDATAAYQFLRGSSIPWEKIYLFGESLGGAVAVELATRFEAGGLILESTFTSVREMASQHYSFMPTSFVPDRYNSLARIPNILPKLLIIHGDRDEIVPYEMGEKLYKAAPPRKEFVNISTAKHNDVYIVGGHEYQRALLDFFNPPWVSKSLKPSE